MKRVAMTMAAATACALIFGAVAGPELRGQTPTQASQPVQPQQPGTGGRGRGRGGPPPPPRAGAPVDLTGTWVAVVTEDWMWRMRTPPKGDYTSVPLSAAGRKVADQWDPSQDGRCEAYGVGGLMRMPTRLRISWENETTLKIESDAGQQTRLLRFGNVPAPTERTLQGHSVAEWLRAGGAFDAFLERGAGPGIGGQRWGELKVTTTNMRPGWLRRNGVPYSENAVITEYFIRISPPDAGEWLTVSTQVVDPQYLAQNPFITSSNFKKEPDNSKWNPTPCRAT
jgi:hypothetical protein